MKIEPDKHLSGTSVNRMNWESVLALNTCPDCYTCHGTIFPPSANTADCKAYHHFCRCSMPSMRTKTAGTATEKGVLGADAFLSWLKRLPDYYVTKSEAKKHGWKNFKGNPEDVLPEKMIGGDVYKNKSEKLPVRTERIWREADIDYVSGYRNTKRILYSDDGLVFVSNDHYQTFYEILP